MVHGSGGKYMSHFTRMQTRLMKKRHLLNALKKMGYQPKEGRVEIRGYDGQKTEVEVMIPSKNPGYDLGFRKSGKTYELVADWHGIKDIIPKTFLNQVQQQYALSAVAERMQAQGFDIVTQENLPDKSIHLTVRRNLF
jgi:hypothetical protein